MVSIASPSASSVDCRAVSLHSVVDVKLDRTAVTQDYKDYFAHEAVRSERPFGVSAVSLGVLVDIQASAASVTAHSSQESASLLASSASKETWAYETNGGDGVVRLDNGATIALRHASIAIHDADQSYCSLNAFGDLGFGDISGPKSRLGHSDTLTLSDGTKLTFGTVRRLMSAEGKGPLTVQNIIESITLTKGEMSLTIENMAHLRNANGSLRPVAIHAGGPSAESLAAVRAQEASEGIDPRWDTTGKNNLSLAEALLRWIPVRFEKASTSYKTIEASNSLPPRSPKLDPAPAHGGTTGAPHAKHADGARRSARSDDATGNGSAKSGASLAEVLAAADLPATTGASRLPSPPSG